MSQVAINAGDLRSRITIQQRSSGQDAAGQRLTTWADLLSCWAAIEPLSGRELVLGQAVNSEVTHRVTVRYRAGITPANRVVYQGRVFNVVSVIDVQNAHVLLQMECSEGLNQG